MSDDRRKVERKTQPDMQRATTSQNQNVGDNLTNDQSASPILKLNVDCLEELFDWLSLADLRSLRQTCKRLKRVVSYSFKTNFVMEKIGYGKFRLYDETYKHLNQLDPTKVKLIKQLLIYDMYDNPLIHNEINASIKDILPQLEKLYISTYKFVGDFNELILKQCTNLKYLAIAQIKSDPIIGDDNAWLLLQYPTIKHILLDDNDIDGTGMAVASPQLRTFFELNTNIQRFSTTFHLLRVNANTFLNSKIKLKNLDVEGDGFLEHDGMAAICNLLNQLYDQGFYERLYMSVSYIDEQIQLDRIGLVRGMEKLHLSGSATTEGKQSILPSMPNLKELGFKFDYENFNFDSVASSLIDVERVYFNCTKTDAIVSFMRFAPNLKEIKVDSFKIGGHFKNDYIDLFALNRERESLAEAKKITMYVNEGVYLSTKMKNFMKTELSLLTLKRVETLEWVRIFN